MKFGFRPRKSEPLKFGFSHRKPTPEPEKFGFRRAVPLDNRMSVNLWDAIVDRDMKEPFYFDGSTAARAVKPVEIPSLLHSMGFKEDVCADEYIACMEAYQQGYFSGENGYQKYRSARAQIGRLGSIPYSWRRVHRVFGSG